MCTRLFLGLCLCHSIWARCRANAPTSLPLTHCPLNFAQPRVAASETLATWGDYHKSNFFKEKKTFVHPGEVRDHALEGSC